MPFFQLSIRELFSHLPLASWCNGQQNVCTILCGIANENQCNPVSHAPTASLCYGSKLILYRPPGDPKLYLPLCLQQFLSGSCCLRKLHAVSHLREILRTLH